MYLRPSEIRFSQDSVGRTFGNYTSHPYRPIGETLDDIITGKINVNSIPTISVLKKDGQWFTADNRRLWVFQEAEKRGKCTEIYVRETSYINYNKFTTINNGISVEVRGNPGGYLWQKMPVTKNHPKETPEILSLPSTRNPILSSHFVYENFIENINEEHQCKIQTADRCITTKAIDSQCFEQDISKDIKDIPMNNENDYSIKVDSDSDNQSVIIKIFDYSSSVVTLQRQGQFNYRSCIQTTAIEEKHSTESEIRVNNEAMVDVSHIPYIPSKISSLCVHSEARPQIEERSVVVTRTDENNIKSCKITISKCWILIVFCVGVFFIALVHFIVGIASM